VLSDEELLALWRASCALEQPYRAFIQTLILSGQRRNEVANLSWREIDFDPKVWVLPKERSKNGRAHVVPLADSVITILRGLPRIADGLVFTLNGRNPIAGFSLIKDRLDALTQMRSIRLGKPTSLALSGLTEWWPMSRKVSPFARSSKP
jgi:integrase